MCNITEDATYLGYVTTFIDQELPKADLLRKEALLYCLGCIKEQIKMSQ
jgi:hypothetical protein